jgi:hypothetical protein
MVRLARANSRMKDFFDIHRLVETRTFDGDTMRLAVAATFIRRDIEIPAERPLALTSEFAEDAQKKVLFSPFSSACHSVSGHVTLHDYSSSGIFRQSPQGWTARCASLYGQRRWQ